MKFAMTTVAAMFFLSTSVLAEEVKTTPADNAVKVLTGTEKKTRKKKVEMCGECGKPESECECHGKKGEEKKPEKK